MKNIIDIGHKFKVRHVMEKNSCFPQGELIVYLCSGVRPSASSAASYPIFKDLLLQKFTWPIKTQFHAETPWEGERKFVYMTKMAATPLYGKNL